jgi:hypothetical protein
MIPPPAQRAMAARGLVRGEDQGEPCRVRLAAARDRHGDRAGGADDARLSFGDARSSVRAGTPTKTALDRAGALSLEASGSGFDSRRLHPEKPSNLNGLLGFSLSSFSSCALSVPLWRL